MMIHIGNMHYYSVFTKGIYGNLLNGGRHASAITGETSSTVYFNFSSLKSIHSMAVL